MNNEDRRKMINSYLNSPETVKKRVATAKKNGLYKRMLEVRWGKKK